MFKKTMTFTDYKGVERTETFLFNMSKADIARMELGTTGGLAEKLQVLIDKKDAPEIMKFFEEFIRMAYGEMSADGRRFIKSEELANEFAQTEAYSDLYMELVTDSEAAARFVNGVIPSLPSAPAKSE